MSNEIHVRPFQAGWDVIRNGGKYAESHHDNQKAAITAATNLARREGVRLTIYGRNGEVQFSTLFVDTRIAAVI